MTKQKQIIIHCPTQKIYNKIIKKFGKGRKNYWNKYKKETCIYIKNNSFDGYCYKQWYIKSMSEIPIISTEKYLNIKKIHQVFNI